MPPERTGRFCWCSPLPIDVRDWRWWDDIEAWRTVAAPEELSRTVTVGCGAGGRQSAYPLAAIDNRQDGLAIAVDMGKPAQYRLACHGGTGQLFLAYDFGLVRDTERFPSSAEFRFVVYRYDAAWGFRAAWDKYTRWFPEYFEVRSQEQGIWLPFTDASRIEGWGDFGFRYHEGNERVATDDRLGLLSFRYTEPMTWWMNMAAGTPRTMEAALATRETLANGPHRGRAPHGGDLSNGGDVRPFRSTGTPLPRRTLGQRSGMEPQSQSVPAREPQRRRGPLE